MRMIRRVMAVTVSGLSFVILTIIMAVTIRKFNRDEIFVVRRLHYRRRRSLMRHRNKHWQH